MTPNQIRLVNKTLGVIGYLSLIGAIGLAVLGIIWAIVNDKSIGDVLLDLLNFEDAGQIFYPLLLLGIVCLWIKAFIKAGSKSS